MRSTYNRDTLIVDVRGIGALPSLPEFRQRASGIRQGAGRSDRRIAFDCNRPARILTRKRRNFTGEGVADFADQSGCNYTGSYYARSAAVATGDGVAIYAVKRSSKISLATFL